MQFTTYILILSLLLFTPLWKMAATPAHDWGAGKGIWWIEQVGSGMEAWKGRELGAETLAPLVCQRTLGRMG